MVDLRILKTIHDLSMEEAAKAYDYYDGKVKGIVDAVRI